MGLGVGWAYQFGVGGHQLLGSKVQQWVLNSSHLMVNSR